MREEGKIERLKTSWFREHFRSGDRPKQEAGTPPIQQESLHEINSLGHTISSREVEPGENKVYFSSLKKDDFDLAARWTNVEGFLVVWDKYISTATAALPAVGLYLIGAFSTFLTAGASIVGIAGIYFLMHRYGIPKLCRYAREKQFAATSNLVEALRSPIDVSNVESLNRHRKKKKDD